MIVSSERVKERIIWSDWQNLFWKCPLWTLDPLLYWNFDLVKPYEKNLFGGWNAFWFWLNWILRRVLKGEARRKVRTPYKDSLVWQGWMLKGICRNFYREIFLTLPFPVEFFIKTVLNVHSCPPYWVGISLVPLTFHLMQWMKFSG